MDSNAIKQQVGALSAQGLSNRNIAERLGIHFSTVSRYLRVFKGLPARPGYRAPSDPGYAVDKTGAKLKKAKAPKARAAKAKPATKEEDKVGASSEYNKDTGELSANLTDTRVRSYDDLVKACNVDLDFWEVIEHRAKVWEMGRKDKQTDIAWNKGVMDGSTFDTGKIFVQPLHSVSARFKPKAEKTQEFLRDHFNRLLDSLEQPVWEFKHAVEEGTILEINAPDLHIGQRTWGSLDAACTAFRDAVFGLIDMAGPQVSKIILVVGHDFYNVDNLNYTTTRGTPQQDLAHWRTSYEAGSELLVSIGSELSMLGLEVDIIVVPGNHDAQRAFYLGDGLKKFFHGNERVTVDNSEGIGGRKYRLFFNTLVGYCHGHNEKPKDLPMLMAHEAKEYWSEAVFYEWHAGHKHTDNDSEFGGVRCRLFRTLAPPSEWGKEKGYTLSVRQATAIEYTSKGPERQYNWYPDTMGQ